MGSEAVARYAVELVAFLSIVWKLLESALVGMKTGRRIWQALGDRTDVGSQTISLVELVSEIRIVCDCDPTLTFKIREELRQCKGPKESFGVAQVTKV